MCPNKGPDILIDWLICNNSFHWHFVICSCLCNQIPLKFTKYEPINFTLISLLEPVLQIRKNWIKHGKILSLVKINSAKTQLTQFSLSCCQRADFSVLSQKRWDKLALFYKHNTNPNENSQFKHWFYIRSYRVKLNSSVRWR